MLFVCRFQHVPRIASRLLGCPDVLARSVSAAGLEPTQYPQEYPAVSGDLSIPLAAYVCQFHHTETIVGSDDRSKDHVR